MAFLIQIASFNNHIWCWTFNS